MAFGTTPWRLAITEAQGWRGSTLVTYEAPEKPLFENFSPGLKHSDGPMTLPCSLSRFQNDHKVLSTCEKVMKMGHPYVLRLESVLKDGDLVTVHERLPVTLADHFRGNVEDFLIGHNRDYVYVAPLFQRLMRYFQYVFAFLFYALELILAFKEFHDIGLMLLPSLSCLYVYTGSEGTISLKISLLQCQSYSPNSSSSPDYLTLYCGTIMRTLIKPYVAKVPELEDFIRRAKLGRWWSNTSDLFRHPLFWSSAMHMDFLESLNIHLHQTTRPTPNPLNQQQNPDGLGDLATEMGKAWRVVPKLWPDSPVAAWMKLCTFPVPTRWSDPKYKHLPLYRQARNLIQHHSEAHFYEFSGPWGCRRDLFLHKLNMTHNLTIILFQVFEKILLVKSNNGVQGKDERARSDMVEDPAIESPCLPPGKPVRLKLPVEIVGDVLQVTVECFVGALTAVVGIEADALLLAQDMKNIFGCLSKENDMLSTDDGGSDATGACESIALSDETIPDWAQLLESVIKLPTIVGARMQKCVNDVLEKGPAEWAKKILAHSTIDLRLAVGAYGGSHDAFLEDVREGWRGSTLVTYEASEKPLFENFSPGLKHSDGPMTLPCSLSRFQNDHKVLSTCEKVMKMGHPYVLRLESVLKDGDLVTVHERLPVTLVDHFRGNVEDFLIGHNRDYVYVAPLFQRLMRYFQYVFAFLFYALELILAFKEFHDIGLMLLPSLSCLYVYTGSEGTISLKISLLQCQSYSPNVLSSSPDYLSLYCGTVMRTLIQPYVAEIPELEDFITRANKGRWWSNTSDLFRHPLFWSSAMHMDFLESLNIHLHQTTRPTPNPLNQQQNPDGLGDLATEMGKAWRVVPKLWPDSPVAAWMNLCTFPVPTRWSDPKYKHLPLYRQARNLIQHHSEAHFYECSGSWGCRRDLFIHKLNMTHNLTIILFQVFEKVQSDYENNNLPSVNLLIFLSLKSSLRLELHVACAYMWLCKCCFMRQLDSNFEEIFQRLKSENRWPELSDGLLRVLLELIVIALHLRSMFYCFAIDFLLPSFPNYLMDLSHHPSLWLFDGFVVFSSLYFHVSIPQVLKIHKKHMAVNEAREFIEVNRDENRDDNSGMLNPGNSIAQGWESGR
ncbi:hypothetical protein RHGRI_028172 [Rhododendron griersonianum]|uniref:Uncharacterized protein n=1 Tax=Rhododendron griersonianum TaxID=479676 RepID=A0AAV6IH34_9ERIC|nr:hypothetical protein RHGRI_028172 [Rhododendron griersonianum]